MKVKEIYPDLFLYTFPNEYELASTFFRLQEFYESPNRAIRKKYFTYEQAIDAYTYLDLKDKKKAKFTYFDDWNGFNVPGDVIDSFYATFELNFTDKEFKLINKLRNTIADNFYIIGVVEKDKSTMKHEVAHGLYYLNKEYKKEMNKLLKRMPKGMKKMAKKYLLSIGYCNAVIKDELHAYFSTGIRRGMICIWHHIVYQSYIRKFKKVFKKYSKDIKQLKKDSYLISSLYSFSQFGKYIMRK